MSLTLIFLPFHTLHAQALQAVSDQGEVRLLTERTSRVAETVTLQTRSTKTISSLEELGTINSMILDGAYSYTSANVTTLANIRIDSDTTRLNDYVSIDMILDGLSLRMLPIKTNVIKNLGVYNHEYDFFSKNITTSPTLLTPNNSVLQADKIYSLSAKATDEFTIELEAGTVLALRLKYPTDDLTLIFKNPEGDESSGLYEKGSNWFIWPYTILTSGKYSFRFEPKNNSSVNLEFGFSNMNSQFLYTLRSGQSFSTTLSGWGESYSKYQLKLKAGDTVDISDPSDDDVYLYLLDSNGQLLQWSGGKLLEKVDYAGSYYLFVVNKDYENSSSYSGKVSIGADPNRGKYPILSSVARQVASVGSNFSLTLLASKNPTSFQAFGLPSGLSIDETTGLISGAPELTGVFAISIVAKNNFGKDRKDFVLEVGGGD